MIAPLQLGARGDIAMLVVRVLLGAAFIMHGFPKIEHPATWLTGMLPHAPSWLAAITAFVEFGGGIALVAGFLTPLFAFLIASDMLVAIFFVLLPRGATFIAGHAGSANYELPAAYLVMSFALMLIGPGAYSIDGARGTTGRSQPGRRRR